MIKHKLSRIIYNIKRYGILRTIKKIFARILKRNKRNSKSDKEIYQKWILQNEPDEKQLELQKKHKFEIEPKISIVVPMYNTDENFFLELLNSLFAQTYTNWELCLADGSGVQNETILAMCIQCDKIKYKFLDENKGISENTNQAIEMATGDYIAFLDHDDCLPPFSLYEIVKTINENPEVEFMYSDEDKIDEKGERFEPYFKPDFSPETLECHNYITHLVVVKKSLLEKVGKLDSRFCGAQDFDFVLRVTENTKNIVHISKILYHWRAHQNSTANVADAKNYAYEVGVKVVAEHLKRTGKEAIVENPGEVPGIYKIKYKVKGNPKVSILIPNKDSCAILKKCIKSILTLTTYENYEILILENNSQKKETFEYYEKIKQNPKVKILKIQEKEFNYSHIVNIGVKNAQGDFILQLNNDTKLLTPDWLEIFIGYAQNKEIGAVGARLYYPDKSIQHAGIACGIDGKAGNLLVNLPYGAHGYFGREALTANVSAVTGACLFARREIYEEVGFMDEELFKVAFNDVDFCLKILEKGYRVVYNPYVELIHYESKTRGYEDTPEKQARFEEETKNFQNKWKDFLEKGDPYYNPNFSRQNCNFEIM